MRSLPTTIVAEKFCYSLSENGQQLRLPTAASQPDLDPTLHNHIQSVSKRSKRNPHRKLFPRSPLEQTHPQDLCTIDQLLQMTLSLEHASILQLLRTDYRECQQSQLQCLQEQPYGQSIVQQM